MNKSNKLFLKIPVLLCCVIVVGSFLYSPISNAKPSVNWMESPLSEVVVSGESVTTTVTFISSVNARNVRVRVVPELSQFVSVSPSSFTNIVKGESYPVTVTSSVPVNTTPGYYDGTIQLRFGKKNLAKPLPVVITVKAPEDRSELILKDVFIQFAVLDEYNISLERHTASTISSEYTFLSGETSTSLEFVEAYKGQILIVTNPDGTPFLVAHISADEIKNGVANITIDSIARGLIILNPLMLGFGEADRLLILTRALSNPLYQDLLSEVKNALAIEPRNLLQQPIFPKIYEYALTLAIEAIDQAVPTALQVVATTASAPTPIVGSDDNPYLGDVPGSEILLVNPTMLFYGVDIPGFQSQVIAGKDSLWELQFGWPPVQFTDPVVEPADVGDGLFDVIYSRYNPKATTANMGRLLCDFLDLLVWCPLTNSTIEKVSELESFPALGSIFDDIISLKSVEEILSRSVKYLLEPTVWNEITRMIYSTAADKQAAVSFLESSKSILKLADKALLALKIYDASNTTAPFIYDLLTQGKSDIEYCVRQTDGVLTAECQLVSPTAVISKSSPTSVYVGDTVTYDASGSFDDSTASSALLVRWDFNGDGDFDSTWSTQKQATWIYSNVGAYNIVLEVKDEYGLVGRALYRLSVDAHDAGGVATHIKAFRNVDPWDTKSFENTMSANGYSLGTGQLQYEVLSSSAFGSEILVPGQDLVVIMNDQNQEFYNDLAANLERIERFIDNGGVVFWGACDLGWNNGSMELAGIDALPGGVGFNNFFDEVNINVSSGSAVMEGLPSILEGTFASHEEFTANLQNATVYTENTRGYPTLMEYAEGNGWIMLTGQPLEYNVLYNPDTMGLLYERVFKYVLGGGDASATSLKVNNSISTEYKLDQIPSSFIE